MRISISAAFLLASACLLPVTASAATGSYICAFSDVYECETVTGCKRASLNAINIPEFIVIDLDKKQLTGASIGNNHRTEDIEGMTSDDKHIFLHGQQDEETWNATITLETGALSGGITSGLSSFAVFGNCTQK
ncbi:MAG: hypothetical protein ACOYB4_07155 [Methyloceanibacter sp.]